MDQSTAGHPQLPTAQEGQGSREELIPTCQLTLTSAKKHHFISILLSSFPTGIPPYVLSYSCAEERPCTHCAPLIKAGSRKQSPANISVVRRTPKGTN